MLKDQLHHPVLTAIVPISEPATELSILLEWTKRIDSRIFLILVINSEYRDSVDTIKESTKGMESVLVLEIDSLGPGAARELGRGHCKTEFIAFWDCDDLPFVEEILQSVDTLRVDVDVLVGRFSRYDISSRETLDSRADINFYSVLYTPGIWRMVFRSKSISGLHFPALRMAEDHVFLAQIIKANLRIEFTSSVFYRYTHGRSKQLSRNQDALSEIPHALEQINSLLLDSTLSSKARRNLYFIYMNLALSHGKRQREISQFVNQVKKMTINGPVQRLSLLIAFLQVLRIKVVHK